MKILFCPYCNDVVAPIPGEMRSCYCGRTKGRYIDKINVETTSTAIPIGIDNRSLLEGILHRPRRGKGKEIVAFVIPEFCETVKYSLPE